MTNKEAIEVLKKSLTCNLRYSNLKDAVNVAIKALQENDKLTEHSKKDECYDCEYKFKQ